MRNVKMEVEGTTLKIEIDLTQDFGPSSTGKTNILASTAGPKKIPGQKAGDPPVSLNLTLFRKNVAKKS